MRSCGELPIIYDIHLPHAHYLVHNQLFIQEEKYYQNPLKFFIHEDTIPFIILIFMCWFGYGVYNQRDESGWQAMGATICLLFTIVVILLHTI